MKKGFGLIEVLAAAVVLGFLLVGLNTLQLGNREAILRIRARDAANDIAQEVIDSIRGSASIKVETRSCEDNEGKNADLCKSRNFKNVTVNYMVTVDIEEAPEQVSEVETTGYLHALAPSGQPNNIKVQHQFAKQVNVTVKWHHKKAPQSINVSAVVR